MVNAALRRSREGGVLARTWRAITGDGVGARVAPAVTYSRAAVQRIVDRARVTVSRPAKDAKVNFTPANLTIRPSQRGRTIDARKLRADVQRALVSATDKRIVTAPIKHIEPKVTGKKLADRYPVVVTVDRGGFRLSLFKDLKRVQDLPDRRRPGRARDAGRPLQDPEQGGQPGVARPQLAVGRLARRHGDPRRRAEQPDQARWLGVYDGVGVHGTDARGSIGTNASHGCIRMLIEDVKKLYDQVPVGTPIFIH